MGTHPIFESDFDCLTEMARVYDLERFLSPGMLGCDKARISIEAVCISHDKLIVTTNESFGYSFRLSPGEEPKSLIRAHLKLRKPISKLAAVDAERIVVLCVDGLLCLLDTERMELVRTKQSQLNKVGDFALNPQPSCHTKGLLDYELLLAGEKKRSVALMHVTADNKLLPIKEFQLQDVPRTLICLGDNGLIQTAGGYISLDFASGRSTPILDKAVPAKLSMITVACFGQFLIEGPGHLGVFLTPQGVPGKPPIQLPSNLKWLSQVGEAYLAVADGEFVTIYGDGGCGGGLEQLQIVPIPGNQLVVHSATVDMQLCATGDAVYSLTKLPFFAIAFHLLGQGQLDEAEEVVTQNESNPPPGMDARDVALYTRRIRAVCGALLVGRGEYDRAAELFALARVEWDELLALFNVHYKIFGFIEPPEQRIIDGKYLTAVSVDKVVGFIASQSMAQIEQKPSVVYIEAYLTIMIDNGATQIELFDMITKLVALNLSSEIITHLTRLLEPQREKYPNSLATLYWREHRFNVALDTWEGLHRGELSDSTYQGINQFGPLIVAEKLDATLEGHILAHLELLLSDSTWFVTVVGAMNLDEETMISRLAEADPAIKLVYLEHLIEKSSRLTHVYMELAKMYAKEGKFGALRAFAREHSQMLDHTMILKWLNNVASGDCNVDKKVLTAETQCRLGDIESGLKSLLMPELMKYFDQMAYQNGRVGLTKAAKLLKQHHPEAFAPFAIKFGVYLSPELLGSVPDETPLADMSALLLGLLRCSERKSRRMELECALGQQALVDSIEQFTRDNVCIERNSGDYSNRCKVTGKTIKEDFYLFPTGIICLPNAAASTDVDPLTGEFLSVHVSKS